MGTTKQVGTWGSSLLLGYSSMPYSKNYYRIVTANKKAHEKGLSYGQYMAGLWEEKERTPIKKEIKEVKKKKTSEAVVLTGYEAQEYIRQLKIKAGTWTEDDIKAKYKGKNSSDYYDYYKADKLNTEYLDIRKMLIPYFDRLKHVNIKCKE